MEQRKFRDGKGYRVEIAQSLAVMNATASSDCVPKTVKVIRVRIVTKARRKAKRNTTITSSGFRCEKSELSPERCDDPIKPPYGKNYGSRTKHLRKLL